MRKEFCLILFFSFLIYCNGLKNEMVNEMEVQGASADEIWAIYGSPDLPRLIVTLLPSVFESIQIIEGDGDLNTIINVTFSPGSVPLRQIEKFVTMDHYNRIKEVQSVGDGYLALGCTYYLEGFHILEKNATSCTIRSYIQYEVPDELAPQVEPFIMIESLIGMANAIVGFALRNGSRHDTI